MALTLKSRTPVRFEITDDDVETTVTLMPEDDEAALVRKMRRIIALVEGERPVITAWPAPVQGPDVSGGAASLAPPVGNGWAAYAAPELPEDRKGDYEMIPPEEQG